MTNTSYLPHLFRYCVLPRLHYSAHPTLHRFCTRPQNFLPYTDNTFHPIRLFPFLFRFPAPQCGYCLSPLLPQRLSHLLSDFLLTHRHLFLSPLSVHCFQLPVHYRFPKSPPPFLPALPVFPHHSHLPALPVFPRHSHLPAPSVFVYALILLDSWNR